MSSPIRFVLLLSLWILFAIPSALCGDEPEVTIEIGSNDSARLLQKITKDRTLKLSHAETTLQFQIFKELQKQTKEGYTVDVLEVEKSGIFQKLIKFPEENRGKLFRTEGQIRHVTKLPVDKNAMGITSLYQIHFYPFDSEGLPLLLVCTSLPEGVSTGNNLLLESSVVGLFFKIQALPEGSKQAAAPLLFVEKILLQQGQDDAMGLSPEHFSVVNHKSMGIIGAAESELYYRILKLAQSVPHKEQVAAARQFKKVCRAKRPRYQKKPNLPFATYYDLFKHFKEYEGKPVILKGVVREHKQYPANKNDYGITTLHELWIFNEDAQSNPAVLVCTTVPEGFPVGKDVTEMVEMTGFFFKMYGYKAQDNTRRVPMLLGNTVKWYPSKSSPTKTNWHWVASFVVLFFLIIFALWRMRRGDKEYQTERAKIELPDEPDFSNLEDKQS